VNCDYQKGKRFIKICKYTGLAHLAILADFNLASNYMFGPKLMENP